MKKFLALAVCMMIPAMVCAPASAMVDRFDEVTTEPDAAIGNGYAGFNWQEFWVLNAPEYPWNPSGYLNGLVSGDYVAFNGWGTPAEFSGRRFNFEGVYLTSAWRDGMNIDIEGYRFGTLIYSETIVLNTNAPVWFEADYLNVDRVRFVSSGGTHHTGYAGDGTQFAMDNLTFSPVPAPGAILLVSLGTALVGCLRRRHAL